MQDHASMPFTGHETLVVEIFTELEDLAQALKELVQAINVPRIGEAKAKAFADRCEALIIQPNLVELVNELLNHMTTAIECDDAENMFYLLFALARHLDQQSLDKVVAGICDLTAAAGADKAEVSFKILANLYSIVSYTSPSRYTIYLAMINLVQKHKLKNCLSNDLDNLNVLFRQWESTTDQQQVMLEALIEAFEATEDTAAASDSLLAFLSLFDANSPRLASTVEHAAKAALLFVKDPFSKSEYSVVHLNAVKNLATDSKYASLYKLVEIFSSQGLKEFQAFQSANAGYLESVSLSVEECTENMKLASLVTLANKNSSVTYEEVATELGIPLSEVESCMVNAMKKDLVDAKLDQLNSTIVINKGTHRSFKEGDWESMSKKLSQWKSAVKTLLHHVETARAEAATAP